MIYYPKNSICSVDVDLMALQCYTFFLYQHSFDSSADYSANYRLKLLHLFKYISISTEASNILRHV